MKSPCLLLPIITCTFVIAVFSSASAQDNWIGPYGGDWSNPANWSTGVPGPTSRALIDSSHNDLVNLDTNPVIGWLMISNPNDFDYYRHELTDGGVARTITVRGFFGIGRSYYYGNDSSLDLRGGSTMTVGGNAVSQGDVNLFNGSKLSIAGGFSTYNLHTGGGGSN